MEPADPIFYSQAIEGYLESLVLNVADALATVTVSAATKYLL